MKRTSMGLFTMNHCIVRERFSRTHCDRAICKSFSPIVVSLNERRDVCISYTQNNSLSLLQALFYSILLFIIFPFRFLFLFLFQIIIYYIFISLYLLFHYYFVCFKKKCEIGDGMVMK